MRLKILTYLFSFILIICLIIALIFALIFWLILTVFLVWTESTRRLLLSNALLFASESISCFLSLPSYLYTVLATILTDEFNVEHLAKKQTDIAYSSDVKGNVLLADIFNEVLITKEGYKFGKEGESISSATGKNVLKGTLTSEGFIFNKALDLAFWEKNHAINAIEKV